jgi:D-threo-aldose 1-dehydrogenase
MRRRQIGSTSVTVTEMGLGGTGLGNMYTSVDHATAVDTVKAAWSAGIRHFDTAPVYGNGLSETRLGAGLSDLPRDELTISTKVGYALEPLPPEADTWNLFAEAPPFRSYIDFSADAVRVSLEASLERLGTDRVDIVWIHDPDEANSINPGADPYEASHFDEAMAEAYPVLDELRAQGAIGAIGVGLNQWQMLEDFADAGEFDCFLLACRYTLLEQPALATFLPMCERRGLSVVIGGPYASGILASGAVAGAHYNYAPAPPTIVERVRSIEELCGRHGIPLAAASLQFPLAHPAVVSVIPGARSTEELEANVRYLRTPIPESLWADLKETRLIDSDAPTPPDSALAPT